MRENRRALIALFCALSVIFAAVLAGCNTKNEESFTATPDEGPRSREFGIDEEVHAENVFDDLGIDHTALGIDNNIYYEKNQKAGFQLSKPREGETCAVIHTTMGDITLRLFSEQAPNAVKNFISLAKSGRYNNSVLNKVINGYGITGGHISTDTLDSPNGLSSFDGKGFEDEFCDKLLNLRGAVSMKNNGRDENGSEFFINHTDAETFKTNGGWSSYEALWSNVKSQLLNYKDTRLLKSFVEENGDRIYNSEIVPEEIKKLYEKYGGNPSLDGAYNSADRGYTVFAQVVKGMDIVNKICMVNVDLDYLPINVIYITSIEIKGYTDAEPTTAPPTTKPLPTTTAAPTTTEAATSVTTAAVTEPPTVQPRTEIYTQIVTRIYTVPRVYTVPPAEPPTDPVQIYTEPPEPAE